MKLEIKLPSSKICVGCPMYHEHCVGPIMGSYPTYIQWCTRGYFERRLTGGAPEKRPEKCIEENGK